ncbi:calcium-binding protein [Nocardioides jensenii]|uniref:calcium-binding protein n=1 Tax=Nocardioides jensenii TaxID=1843 RepID=UPI00082CBF6E|nr:calcium-binding protein [Nocardioides jensenii]
MNIARHLSTRAATVGGVTLLAALLVPLTAEPAGAEPAGAPAYTCAGLRATIVGTTGPDRIIGTAGRDVIVGRVGNDFIDGRGGNDVICGNRGGDVLNGGPGHDRVYGGEGMVDPILEEEGPLPNDTLRGGPGNDRLFPGAQTPTQVPNRIMYDTATRGIRANLGKGVIVGEGTDRVPTGKGLWGSSQFILNGTRFDDVITGGRHHDTIFGAAGDDIIRGRDGNDTLVDGAGSGDDFLDGQGGNDNLMARGGADVLVGGDGRDTLEDTGRTADILRGGPGNDFLEDILTRSTNQVIDGGTGRNLWNFDWTPAPAGQPVRSHLITDLVAGSSRFAGHTRSIVTRGVQRIHMTGVPSSWANAMARGTWTVTGTGANEEFEVTRTRLVAHGAGGNDLFWGGPLNDVINGGAGRDETYGGDGTDTCVSVEINRYRQCENVS